MQKAMFKKAVMAVAAMVGLNLTAASAQSAAEGGYALVNGLRMYYEIRGSGQPLGYSLGGGQRDAGWDGSGRPRAQLAILPGATHYDIFSLPALASTALQFLDAPLPEGK
jgi:hypothetical protein